MAAVIVWACVDVGITLIIRRCKASMSVSHILRSR